MKNIILLALLTGSYSIWAQTGINTPTGTVAGTTTNPSTGNVGIGTSTPSANLHINSNSFDVLRIQNQTGGPGNKAGIDFSTYGGPGKVARIDAIDQGNFNGDLAFYTDGDNANNSNVIERMRITYGGTVGIGTPTPDSKLQVLNSGFLGATDKIALLNISTQVAQPNIGGKHGIRFSSQDGNGGYTQKVTEILNVSEAEWSNQNGLAFHTGGLEQLRIRYNGNVGIGTNNPQNKLDVNGDIQISNASIPMGLVTEVGGTTPLLNMNVNFRGNNLNSSYHGASFRIDTRSGSPLFQWLARPAGSAPGTGESLLMSMNENGNVGIGNTSLSEKLTVQGNVQIPLASSVGYLQSSDKFTHNSNQVGNYSLGWANDSWTNGAPTGYLSAFGGIKLFTAAQPRLAIDMNGNVGIGNTTPDAKLTVSGQVHAQEVKVTVNAPGPDYVFEKEYKLTSLEEIKNYIDQNKHLPEVPSAKEMEKNGVQLGEMNMLLLRKIEELTLYMIEQSKRDQEQKKQIESLTAEVEKLKSKK